MLRIQLHKSASDNLDGLIVTGNSYLPTPAAHDFHNQMQYQIEGIMVIREVFFQVVHIELFVKILMVALKICCPIDFLSTEIGRKERISITKFSIIYISILELSKAQFKNFPKDNSVIVFLQQNATRRLSPTGGIK